MNQNKGIIGLGLIVAIVLGIVVVGGGAYYLGKSSNKQEVKSPENVLSNVEKQNLPVVENKQEVNKVDSAKTYTYKNHGFTMELPVGYIPHEEQAEGGPALMITLPVGGLAYITDASFWEKYNTSNYTYIKDEKIGDTTFKVYDYMNTSIYWFKQGNVGYEFSMVKFSTMTDSTKFENIIKTFKFVGLNDPKTVSTVNWKTYTNSEYGFSFNYPSSWKLSEDKTKKEVTIDTNIILPGPDGSSYPSSSVTFKSTNKTFFNNLRPTKIGVITYNESKSAVFADGDRCLKADKLLGSINASVQLINYGGSIMSTPAYSDSAILTTNGQIIIIHSAEDQITTDLKSQYAMIANSFKLLNSNTVFVPECAK